MTQMIYGRKHQLIETPNLIIDNSGYRLISSDSPLPGINCNPFYGTFFYKSDIYELEAFHTDYGASLFTLIVNNFTAKHDLTRSLQFHAIHKHKTLRTFVLAADPVMFRATAMWIENSLGLEWSEYLAQMLTNDIPKL